MRRYFGPVAVVALMLGLFARLLTGAAAPPVPAEPLVEVDPMAIASQVPLAEGNVVFGPAEPPDPRIIGQQRLREAVFAPFRSLTGRFGIAVKDLGSGLTVLLNETLSFQAASLYKVPVMYEVFKLREAGALTFGEEMTIGAADAAQDLGSLPWPIGTRITIGTALERMITISDNSGAVMLARRVGAWRINEDAAELGLNQTHVRGGDLATSPLDMLRLLEMMAAGDAIDPETSAEMVHLMARQQVRDRIPSLLPNEATVANKTGNWERAVHDVGIVYGPRSTVVLALLSDGSNDLDGVHDAIAQAARNVYDVVNDPDFVTEPIFLPALVRSTYAASPRLPVVAAPPRPAAPPVGAGRAPARSGQPPASSTREQPTQLAPTQKEATQSGGTARPTQREATSPATTAPAPSSSGSTAPSRSTSKPEAPATKTDTPASKPSSSTPTRTPKPEATAPQSAAPSIFAPNTGLPTAVPAASSAPQRSLGGAEEET